MVACASVGGSEERFNELVSCSCMVISQEWEIERFLQHISLKSYFVRTAAGKVLADASKHL